MFDADEIRKKLAFGKCTVVFTKADGSTRVMNCTTSEAYVPPSPNEGKAPQRAPNPSLIRAYDLDINEWRSFNVDRVQSFKTS